MRFPLQMRTDHGIHNILGQFSRISIFLTNFTDTKGSYRLIRSYEDTWKNSDCNTKSRSRMADSPRLRCHKAKERDSRCSQLTLTTGQFICSTSGQQTRNRHLEMCFTIKSCQV